jgi:hypothetical protein
MKTTSSFRFYFFNTSLFLSIIGATFYSFYTLHKKSFEHSDHRNPASLIHAQDLDLRNENLQKEMKNHLIKGLQVLETETSAGVELGGFNLSLPDGTTLFACEEFPKLILVFEGEGVATSGQKPLLEIEGPCLETTEGKIQGLLIPHGDIAKRPPFQGEVYLSESQIMLRFYHTEEYWPQAWALTGVYLQNSMGVTHIEVSILDLIRQKGRPVGFSWPSGL